MKPPPRTRSKPARSLDADPGLPRPCRVACKWQRPEQRRLLKALDCLNKTSGGLQDIDYAFLNESVPTRSISEIHSVVDALKNKAISCAVSQLQRKRAAEKKVRKPIEKWTHMASAVAGNLEDVISTAFSQMLMVSSTEPCTLRNCDPPQIHRPPTSDKLVGRTVPLRPMAYQTVRDDQSGTNTAHPLLLRKTPAPTICPARKVSAPPVPNSCPPQQQPSPKARTSPAATSTPQTVATSCELDASPPTPSHSVNPATGHVAPTSCSAAAVTPQSSGGSERHPATISSTSTSNSTSSSCHMPLSSTATSFNPAATTAPLAATSICSSNCPTPPLSSPATAFHSKSNRTSKYAINKTFGVKWVVDFERIYRFLSAVQKPTDDCHLTPMESAIMLDLLMSLPEELQLLDCNKLHTHLIQMYQCLLAPADSPMAREKFENLKGGLEEAQEVNWTKGQKNTAGTADSTDVTESQSSGSHSTPSQSDNPNRMGLCPPLNPFMVPLKLLRRKTAESKINKTNVR